MIELAYEYWPTRPAVDATVVAELPAANFAYQLRGLLSRLTQNAAGGLTVTQSLKIVDGQSNVVMAFAMDPGQRAGEANGTVLTQWGPGLGVQIGVPEADGGTFIQTAAIPPDLWILPQWKIQLHYQGTTAGGYSGGDVWEGVVQTIARRP